MKNDLLIVIDMQNDFIDGPLGTPEAQAIVPKVAEKIERWHGDIILTKDTHHEDYLNTREGILLPVKHCIKYTKGWELNPLIVEALNNRVNAWVIHKPSFGYTDWGNFKGITNHDTITLIGLCTDICVISNALLLKNTFPEMDIYVDSACCAGVTPAKHEAALEVMRSCQIKVY